MRVAGIDISTRAVDVVLLELDSDEARWEHRDLHGEDWLERLRDIQPAMWGVAYSIWDDVAAIALEQPPSKLAAGAKLSAFFGAVVACLPTGPLVTVYQPAEWRKRCGLSGTASKEAVASWGRATRQGEWLSLQRDWTQDAYDAFAIAWACRSQLVVEEVA